MQRHSTSSPADPIVYRICPEEPHRHLFRIELLIKEPAAEGQLLALPAWIPGSYMIREFARHIVTIAAQCDGTTLQIDKQDKHTWRTARAKGAIAVTYTVYAWDLSVRAAHLDASHGFFNPSSLCLRVLGQESSPCTVILEPPPEPIGREWRVATTLTEAGAERYGFGRYEAVNYDALIDHPVEMGSFTLGTFRAGGAQHELAVSGCADLDMKRLTRDLAPVCAAHARLFEPDSGRAPFGRYVFLTTAVNDGYGGLEHRDSTALLCKRSDLPWRGMGEASDSYRAFLGLASHEYLHAWLVKRIKPAAFVKYDLDRETYTRQLWIFEGFTSYYDDLMLVRAGVTTEAQYLKGLADTISRVMASPGRQLQSVAESSFDAWIKYYRQDENSPNAIVSYYAKGALIALAIDLSLRARTGGRASLDDVLRLMWARFGRGFYTRAGTPGRDPVGIPEDAFPGLVREATGVALNATLKRWVDGTEELPLARLLAPLGIALKLAPTDATPSLGIRTGAAAGGLVAITHAYTGGAAQRAGLSAGDVLVACNGLRLHENNLKSTLARMPVGDTVEIHAFRRDVLLRYEVTLAPPAATQASLVAAPRANALRRAWLGISTPTPAPSQRSAA